MNKTHLEQAYEQELNDAAAQNKAKADALEDMILALRELLEQAQHELAALRGKGG